MALVGGSGGLFGFGVFQFGGIDSWVLRLWVEVAVVVVVVVIVDVQWFPWQ